MLDNISWAWNVKVRVRVRTWRRSLCFLLLSWMRLASSVAKSWDVIFAYHNFLIYSHHMVVPEPVLSPGKQGLVAVNARRGRKRMNWTNSNCNSPIELCQECAWMT